MNRELKFADGASTTTNMVPPDDGGIIIIPAIYRDLVEVFRKAKAETLLLHLSTNRPINFEPSYTLPYGWITSERS